MKFLLLLSFFIPSVLWAQTGFVINGKVNGLPEGATVKITSVQDSNNVLVKGTVKNNAFILKGAVAEPNLYYLLLPKEQPHYIFLDNSAITISGDKKDIKHIKIEGSKTQNDFEVFKQVFNPLVGDLNAVVAQINKTDNENRRAELMVDYDSLLHKLNNEVENFITPRHSSYVSPFLLSLTAQMLDDPIVLEHRYNSLDAPVRNSAIGKNLADYIAYTKVGAVGTDALDFTLPDVNGNKVSLSSYKGKYVLVDFWASWCKPCRIENPNVVKAYQKFSSKNFAVLGVSLDQEREPWLKAIEKDHLAWTHVSDLQFWNNAAAVLYHVQGIPQNFLIDPNGKIIAKGLRGEDLENKLCALLGCN